MRLFHPIAWRPAVVLALTMAGAMGTAANVLWPLLAAALVPLLGGWRAKTAGVAGLVLGFVFAPVPPAPAPSESGVFAVRVLTLPRPVGGGASFLAETKGRRLAAWTRLRTVAIGDRLLVEGSTRPLQRGPDDYLLSRGVSGRLNVRTARVVAPGPAWGAWVARAANGLGERLRERLGPERGQLAAAIAFNLDGDLEDGVDATLRRSGAYHLVSASGLHAALLAVGLMALGRIVPVPRGVWIGITFLVLLGYCVLTGWHAATVRASVLWGLGSAAYLLRRMPDGLSALGLFVAFWLAASPFDLYDLGFGLSVVVTAAILAFRMEGPLRIQDAKTGFVAWIASEPIAALAFGRLTPLAVPSNLALGAASEVVLVLSALTAVIPWAPLATVTGWTVDGLYAIARAFGTPAWAFWPAPWMRPEFVPAFEGALLLLWLVKESRSGENARYATPPP